MFPRRALSLLEHHQSQGCVVVLVVLLLDSGVVFAYFLTNFFLSTLRSQQLSV
jgi:hypothetical protein